MSLKSPFCWTRLRQTQWQINEKKKLVNKCELHYIECTLWQTLNVEAFAKKKKKNHSKQVGHWRVAERNQLSQCVMSFPYWLSWFLRWTSELSAVVYTDLHSIFAKTSTSEYTVHVSCKASICISSLKAVTGAEIKSHSFAQTVGALWKHAACSARNIPSGAIINKLLLPCNQ